MYARNYPISTLSALLLLAGVLCFGPAQLKSADLSSQAFHQLSADPAIGMAAEVSVCLDGISNEVRRQLLAGAQSVSSSDESASEIRAVKFRLFHCDKTGHVLVETDDDWDPTIPEEEETPEDEVTISTVGHEFNCFELHHSPQSPPPERVVFLI
jgi:hypothetical protein